MSTDKIGKFCTNNCYTHSQATPIGVVAPFADSKRRAWTGHAGIQSSQCVQVGSSIITRSPDKSNASTGQIATQAAQPKHLPSLRARISPGRFAIDCSERIGVLKTHPNPFVSFGTVEEDKDAIEIVVSNSISDNQSNYATGSR